MDIVDIRVVDDKCEIWLKKENENIKYTFS